MKSTINLLIKILKSKLIDYKKNFKKRKKEPKHTQMDYQQFFFDSLSIILVAFQEYTPKDYIGSLKKKYQQIVTPNKSIYVEIFAFNNNTRTKIQQWKFKPKNQTIHSHLERSYSQQNSNDDSELSFSELNEPTFFKTLQNIRKNIQPKLLLKKMERPKVICEIKDSEHQLISFESGNTFYFEVSEYENELFQVKLSFKYNYEDEVVAQQLNEMKILKQSDSDDFQLLIDQSYQRRLHNQKQNTQANNQNCIKSLLYIQGKQNEGNIPENKFFTSKLIMSGNIKLSQIQNKTKSKRQQQFEEIQKIFKNIDFSTVQSTRLKTFLEYLL